ncbi:MAG: anaerobic ribonucleoside-triphosphate reductase activating protein [Eggerthellaceae bacterium]|jgi:pyruvate formate lyase activating enzyme
MRISGIQKLTLLDYPGKTAATVFTPGCNLRCPFCQNHDLVLGRKAEDGTRYFPLVPEEELFALLDKRAGLLDGVCITGGEPLLQPDLTEFCRDIHARGFLVKLDTNGTLPGRLERLLATGYVDYVALDIKNAPARYAETSGMDAISTEGIGASLIVIANSGVPYECRTTVTRELHTKDDLRTIARHLHSVPAWYLQQYRDSEGVIAGSGIFHAWPPEELEALLPELQRLCPAAQIRNPD